MQLELCSGELCTLAIWNILFPKLEQQAMLFLDSFLVSLISVVGTVCGCLCNHDPQVL